MSSPLAVSAIKTNRTNVVGAGLKLKSRIDFKKIGIAREQADEWEQNTEKEFALWADSVWCDSMRLNNFYELQQLALMSWLMNGDCFGLVNNVEPTAWMPYGIRLFLIESDRVCTPNLYNVIAKNKDGKNIYSGVEIDNAGAIIAYHVCNKHPNSNISFKKAEWVRVQAFSKVTGNPNVLHIMESERCEQYRGVPYLAPVIETIKQITRYTEAELTAAVIQAFFTAFIKVDSDRSQVPFGDSISDEEKIETDPSSYEMGAGTINVLGENEDVVFADPKRPSSGFEGFVNSMTKQIGAALEIPFELLNKSFTASYSASRAALLEAWKAFKMRRTWFANDFCQPIYEMWLSEAIARGRVKAPGFFNDPSIKKAWSRSEWIGPAQGMLDPVKEVNAAILRTSHAFSTHERETTELTGGNWDDNINQVTRENELLSKILGAQNNSNQTMNSTNNNDDDDDEEGAKKQ